MKNRMKKLGKGYKGLVLVQASGKYMTISQHKWTLHGFFGFNCTNSITRSLTWANVDISCSSVTSSRK